MLAGSDIIVSAIFDVSVTHPCQFSSIIDITYEWRDFMKKYLLIAVLVLCMVIAYLEPISTVNKLIAIAACAFGIYYVWQLKPSNDNKKS